MALTPQNSEAFFREVDDDLRHERMIGFLSRYGRLVAALVLLGLAALAGWLWWQGHRAQAAGRDAEALAPVLQTLQDSGAAGDTTALAEVAKSSRPAYRALAAMTLADTAALKGDAAKAASQYSAIAADDGAPQPIRDLAILRSVTARYDTLPPAQVIDQLKTLTVPSSPWFPSAAELTALAQLQLGHKAEAGKLLAAIAADKDAPGSLRGRAAGLATLLGQTVQPNIAANIKE